MGCKPGNKVNDRWKGIPEVLQKTGGGLRPGTRRGAVLRKASFVAPVMLMLLVMLVLTF